MCINLKIDITNRGVTLIELLIVVALIGLLVTGFVTLIDPFARVGQANDAKRKSDLVQLTRALEIYYQDNGRYPPSSGSYVISGTSWGGAWGNYMKALPRDPSAGRNYVYYTPNSGSCLNYQCYYIYASLQGGGNDPQACFPGSGNACANAAAFGLSTRCGGTCNYGVTSANTSP